MAESLASPDPGSRASQPANGASQPRNGADGAAQIPGAGDPPEQPHLRRTVWLAGAAFLLLGTSVAVAWWRVTNVYAGLETWESVGLWSGGSGLARREAVWATIALAALPLPVLFVRLAARSWVHEPASWRRDMAVCAALALAASASVAFWPVEGWFWDSETFVLEGGGELVVSVGPALGWWLGLLSGGLLVWAWAWCRPRIE